MNRLKMAVVGTGALGRHHARILAGLDEVELVAVADTNRVTGCDIAQKFNTRWHADYRDVLDQVDAAVIAVPTCAHLAVATEFLSRGIPLLVEKPIASNLQQARQIATLAEQHSVVLQVGHIERFNPAFQAAQPLIEDPKYIRSERFSPYAFRSTDIGVVHDVMIHDIDLVLALVQSPVVRVESFGISVMGGNEDCVQARLRFASGCVVDLSASRVNPETRRQMQVWGSTGCVNIDFGGKEVVAYCPSDTLKYGTPPLERARQPGVNIDQLKSEVFGTFLKVQRPEVMVSDALTDELRSFIQCVQTESTPLVSGQQAVAAMTVADEILQGIARHQWDANPAGAIGPFGTSIAPLRQAG